MNTRSNIERIGNFTSSEIYKLTSTSSRPMTDEELQAHKAANPKSRKTTITAWPGTAAKTYISEKNMERRLGRPLSDEITARAFTWGKLCEGIAFGHLPFDYVLTSERSITHQEHVFWAGSPDGETEDAVYDIKCPITLKSFCKLVDCLYPGANGEAGLSGIEAMQFLRDNHDDAEQYYWQLVSNSILTKKPFAELIIYMPYRSELDEIRNKAIDFDHAQWIGYADDNELPYLIDGGYYKNINIIRFEVPQADKDLLTGYVEQAGAMLIQSVVDEAVGAVV